MPETSLLCSSKDVCHSSWGWAATQLSLWEPSHSLECIQFLLYSKVTQSYICIHFFSHIVFHHGLSQETGYSSLCYTVGPHCLTILDVIVLHLPTSNSQSIPLPPPPW